MSHNNQADIQAQSQLDQFWSRAEDHIFDILAVSSVNLVLAEVASRAIEHRKQEGET